MGPAPSAAASPACGTWRVDFGTIPLNKHTFAFSTDVFFSPHAFVSPADRRARVCAYHILAAAFLPIIELRKRFLRTNGAHTEQPRAHFKCVREIYAKRLAPLKVIDICARRQCLIPIPVGCASSCSTKCPIHS